MQHEASMNHGTGSELVTDSLDESSWVLTSLNTLETQTSEDAIPLALLCSSKHAAAYAFFNSLSLSIDNIHACLLGSNINYIAGYLSKKIVIYNI